MAFRRCSNDIVLVPLLCLLLVSALSLAAGHERAHRQGNWMDQDLNVIIDTLLPNITQRFPLWKVEPLFLGNLHSKDLSDCWLQGLSSAYRSGNSYFLSADNSTTFVNINIGFERLTGSCKFYKKILFLKYRGQISMQISNLTTYTRVNQPMHLDANPTLEFLDVTVPSNMQVEASGSGTVSLVVNTVELFYKRRLRQLVRTNLLEKLQNVMEQYLSQITLNDINEAFRLQTPQMLFNASVIQITLD